MKNMSRVPGMKHNLELKQLADRKMSELTVYNLEQEDLVTYTCVGKSLGGIASDSVTLEEIGTKHTH